MTSSKVLDGCGGWGAGRTLQQIAQLQEIRRGSR